MLRALLAALLFLMPAVDLHAEEEPPAPRPAAENVLLAAVESDPQGEATRLAREALAARVDGDLTTAYERWMLLAERHGDVLLPLRLFGAQRYGRGDGALRWPVRQAVNLALAHLPEPYLLRAIEGWAPRIEVLAAAAARRETAALETLAASYGASARGSHALLLLAELDLESGRLSRAARRLEHWLDLNPRADRAQRAAVAVRVADALRRLDDAGGLEAFALAAQDLREEPVRAGGSVTTLAERTAIWRAETVSARIAAWRDASRMPRPSDPLAALEAPAMLWSRSLVDERGLRAGERQRGLHVSAGVWARGNALLLHEGRVVRRVDLATGMERWRFPRREPVTLHAPSERYHSFDIPWRCVTPAGDDSVLVVLGDPAASGRYTFLEQEYEAGDLGQESRPRLVCLDVTRGTLRWHTGALDESHPVLGHLATGCASPPLVVGDAVYCVFAQRIGSTTFHLACLDRRTGRPRWVRALAAGESGRADDQGLGRDRFTSSYAQSVPFGARPTLAGGEVCVLPHAGFAAGVDATDGRVHWLRALPRYALNVTVAASEGHSIRNAPLAWGDSWILAPMDCPHVLCLARGTGDLRWQRGPEAAGSLPEWRDLLGIARGRDRRPRLRLSGWRPGTIDPADGAQLEPGVHAEWDVAGDDPGGAALDVGPFVLRAAAGAVQARAWEAEDGREDARTLEARSGMPVPAGDIVRAGSLWLVVGRDEVAALAPESTPSALARLLADDGQPDAAARAAVRVVRARLENDAGLLEDAVELAATVADEPLRTRVQRRIADALEHLAANSENAAPEMLARWAAVARRLPVALRGAALREIARRMFEEDASEAAARLLVAWLETADDTLVPLRAGASWWREGNAVRGDLVAATMLRAHADEPGVAAVLEEREQRMAEELARMLADVGAGPPRLRAALRRAAGTRAAHAARAVLMRRAVQAEDFDAAAAHAADLRLDPPWSAQARPVAARLREAAQWQLQEAGHAARAFDGGRARELLSDLERWGPGGLKDAQGRTQSVLRAQLDGRFGWRPGAEVQGVPERFDAWQGVGRPRDRDETRSVEFLTLTGPGADRHPDLVVLVRGLTLELWSRSAGRRLAELHGSDEGWFGGSLASVDGWVPGGGILVTSLVAGEPADRSGVRGGDWVHTWSGRPVTDLPVFMQLVAASEPGRTIPVGIWRGGRRVLAQFTAGRRPASQGRLITYGPLWADARGRLLTPGRTGLSWVDVGARTRTPHWSWREPGVVRRCEILGGRAYVLITRNLRPDLVVALDLERGEELWRVEVQGSVAWLESVGSALCIQTLSPSQSVLVDRRDGSVRARYATFARHHGEFRKTWHADRETDLACGRAWLVSGTDAVQMLRVVNTSTAAVEHRDAWSYSMARNVVDYVNPQVAAGACVAILRGGRVRLYVPDPLGGAPRYVVDLGEDDLLTARRTYGPAGRDARIWMRGRHLYLLRVPVQGRRNVNVCVFRLDHEALARRAPTAGSGGASPLQLVTSKVWLGGPSDPRRYVLNAEATFDGLLVSTATLTGDHRAETWWIAPTDGDGDAGSGHVRLLAQSLRDARRHVPVRVGDVLFVPTDEGAGLHPVRRGR